MADPEQHDDDAIGFATPESLAGTSRHQAASHPPVTSPPKPRDIADPVLRGLYARYVLILCAVPTLGVAVLIGLLAVLGRDGRPDDALAHSHFIYQKRTLIVAAIAAAVGVVGIAIPFIPIGVFILFGLAIWIVTRGGAGLMRLVNGKPIARPLSWWV